MSDSHTARIVYQLSQKIIQGEILAGERLAEIPLAEQIGVSRTPVRQALAVLEREGLLIKDSRSYTVRYFGLQEILDAIEVRAALEGLAAGALAQKRMPPGIARELDAIMAEAGEALRAIEAQGPTAQLTEQYFSVNARFHRTIIAGCGSRTIAAALEVTGRVPFASVGSIARYSDATGEDPEVTREKVRNLLYSHMQHQDILDAIKSGESARAEALMRGHAHLGIKNLHLRDNYPGDLGIGLANAFVA